MVQKKSNNLSQILERFSHHDFPNGLFIQRTQNKDAQAIHLKLNEIVAALEGASNNLIDVEDLTENELERFTSII